MFVFYCKLNFGLSTIAFCCFCSYTLIFVSCVDGSFFVVRVFYCCNFFYIVAAVGTFIVIFQGKMSNTLRTVIRVG